MRIVTSYLGDVIEVGKRAATITKLVHYIKQAGFSFNAVAFCGMSGALIAPAIAEAFGVEMIMVRKRDRSHSAYEVEGAMGSGRYIIVDDLISTGSTIEHIIERIKSFDNSAVCDGVVTYSGHYTQIRGEYLLDEIGYNVTWLDVAVDEETSVVTGPNSDFARLRAALAIRQVDDEIFKDKLNLTRNAFCKSPNREPDLDISV